MCNFWCLSDLLTTKFQEFPKNPKMYFKTFLDLCCVTFLEPLDDHRPGFKSETCSKKMIELNNFSKIENYKFESNFQVEIHKKKAIKVKKFSAAARLAAAAHASACEKVSRFEKKRAQRKKNEKFNFWDIFLNFEHERT